MWLLVGDSAGLYQESWPGIGSRTSELVLNIELAGVANTRLKLQNYSCWVTCCVYLSISRTLPATLPRGTVGGLSPPCFYGGSRNRLWAQAKVVLRMPDWFLLPSLLLAACLLLFIVTYLHIVFSPRYRWGNSTDNSSRAEQVPESEHSSPPFMWWRRKIENVHMSLFNSRRTVHKFQKGPHGGIFKRSFSSFLVAQCFDLHKYLPYLKVIHKLKQNEGELGRTWIYKHYSLLITCSYGENDHFKWLKLNRSKLAVCRNTEVIKAELWYSLSTVRKAWPKVLCPTWFFYGWRASFPTLAFPQKPKIYQYNTGCRFGDRFLNNF